MASSPQSPLVPSLYDIASDLNDQSLFAPHNTDYADLVASDPSRPRWENMPNSPIIEQIPSKYKLKLKYGGFFRSIKNSCRKRYCFGSQKSIYMESCSYNLNDLIDEVMKHYPSRSDLIFTSLFVDKYANQQSFIELDSHDNFKVMLSMYEEEKEVTIYVRAEKNIDRNGLLQIEQHEVFNETHGDDDSDYCPSEESYHSRYSTDSEKDQWVHGGAEEKIYPPTIKRPPGRPKKCRFVPSDESKRKHKCWRCGMYGHHQKTCKNPAPLVTTSQVSEFGDSQNTSQPPTSKSGQGKNSQARRSKKSKPCDVTS